MRKPRLLNAAVIKSTVAFGSACKEVNRHVDRMARSVETRERRRNGWRGLVKLDEISIWQMGAVLGEGRCQYCGKPALNVIGCAGLPTRYKAQAKVLLSNRPGLASSATSKDWHLVS